ncbi:MAG TPA: UvrD-helicase domain-containing protein, partial [Myxococcota bacterium]|nr:UvrD-helicase domain-containing protein [Myxococcota bacterium]
MTRFDATTWPLTGRWLIEASAGTGKTWTIAQLYVRLVVERGLAVEQILVITYTKAAAAELRDRLRARLVEAREAVEGAGDALTELVEGWGTLDGPDPLLLASQRLAAAIQGFDRAAIFTIHGFCARTLQEHAFESGAGFDVELSAEGTQVADRVRHDLWTSLLHHGDPLFVAWATGEVWVNTSARLVELGLRPDRPMVEPRAAPAVDVP